MKIDSNCLTYRLAVGILFAFALVAGTGLFVGNRIINNIIEDYRHLVANYQSSETRQLFEASIAELTTARLLDNPQVLAAQQQTLIEAIRLNWAHRGLGGIIVGPKGSTILTTFSPELTRKLSALFDQDYIEIKDQDHILFGPVELVHPWNLRVMTAAEDHGYNISGHEIPLMLALLVLGPLIVLVALFFILRRQVQQPVSKLVHSMTRETPVDKIGVTEFDYIGEAFNVSLSRIRERSISLAQELTERQLAEEVILGKETRIRLLLNSTAEGLYGIDEHGVCTFCNSACCRLLGYSEAELLGTNLHALIHHSHADGTAYPEEQCHINQSFRSNQETHIDSEVFWRADGSSFAVEYWSHPISEHGTNKGAMVTFFDITQRKFTQEALIAEKNKFESIIAGMGDGVSIQDKNYTVIFQNEVHKSFIGDHLGATCYQAFEHKDQVCSDCPVTLAMTDGKVHCAERSIATPAGPRHFEISASPLRDGTDAIVGGIEVVRDVTERKKAEEQLIHAQKMEGIGHLAGGVAHDFNNVLNVVQGYAELLNMERPTDISVKEYTGHIQDAVRRGTTITRQILSFSRKEAMTVKTTNLNELVIALQKMLRRLIREDIDIQITPSATPLMISADASQIDQVLINLTTNACHAMPGGGTFHIANNNTVIDDEFIKAHGFGVAGPYALITVTDSGIGMDDSVRQRIFEPFFTTKEVDRGTGLGLSMVYGIISRHHGFITVLSEPGQGTTFKIYLPLVDETFSHPNREVEKVDNKLLNGTETILIAEDDHNLRLLLQTLLSAKGYTVITSENGEDAVHKQDAQSDSIHLVLLDGIMPRMNGKEALLKMRARHPDLKAIVLSGYAEDVFTQKELLDLKVTFLEKPVATQHLMLTIRQVLDDD